MDNIWVMESIVAELFEHIIHPGHEFFILISGDKRLLFPLIKFLEYLKLLLDRGFIDFSLLRNITENLDKDDNTSQKY